MAEIKTLKQGETQVLPRTVAEAVNTDSGLSVQAELDALKESTPDVSAQINEHNVAEDAHANRFANYLPLSGGTITGGLVIGNNSGILFEEAPELMLAGGSQNSGNLNVQNIGFGETNGMIILQRYYDSGSDDGISSSVNTEIIAQADTISLQGIAPNSVINLKTPKVFLSGNYNPTEYRSVVNKKYVDEQIAAIPTPDVSTQIEAHNTSTTAHANMHWLTADDEMLSSIDPDSSIDADTLEGHPASDYVLKSELSALVPAPDLSNYYTKTEVDAKITQIQQLIDQAAALVDEINGEVI